MDNTDGFSPRRCKSAGSLSFCIEREMSRIILSLHTTLGHVEIFEKTVTDSFSSVNTRLAFDTQILLPNLENKEDLQNNPLNKDLKYKVVCNLKLDAKKAAKKGDLTKILKLDENNQYGHGMTKPLLTDYIRDNNDLSWKAFNTLLEKVDLEDEIGHLYIVDIMFDAKNTSKRQLAHNKIYPPIIEKRKIIDSCERSVFQLLKQYVEGENKLMLIALQQKHMQQC